MKNEIVLTMAGRESVTARRCGISCAMVLVPAVIIPEEPDEPEEKDNKATVANGVLFAEGNGVAEIVENVLTVSGECSATIRGNVVYVN